MNRDLKIKLVQETHYAQVVNRYYYALMPLWCAALREGAHVEDGIEICGKTFTRKSICEILTHSEDVLPADFIGEYNRVLDSALHIQFINEIAAITEPTQDNKPLGQTIDTVLDKLEEKGRLFAKEGIAAAPVLRELRRMHTKHSDTIKKFRDGRHALHHGYTDMSLAVTKVRRQSEAANDVVTHIYNMLNRISRELFGEKDLPDPFDSRQLWTFSSENLAGDNIWCRHQDYLMTDNALEAADKFFSGKT